MVTKVFGPVLGAGVQVREEEADKPIEQASLGVSIMMGIMERGPLNKLVLGSKRKDYLKRFGSYIPESQVPDNAFDFYNLSNGAGELWFNRITDGNHKNAEIMLLSRHQPIAREVLKLTAAYQGLENPGRWAGKEQCIVDEYTAVGTNTLSTGKTMEINEFKDALLVLSAVPGKSFKVVSNDAAGILTFETDVDLTAELGGSLNQLYSLTLSNDGRALSARVLDGEDNPTTEFGLELFVNGNLVKRYPNLNMDPNSANYVESVINDDTGNYWVKAEVQASGTITADTRPANFSGTVKTITATILTADIHRLIEASIDDALVVSSIGTPTLGGSIKKDTLTLTCTAEAAGAATFSVVSALQGALGDLTEAVAYVTNEYLAGFTLTNTGGGEYTIGDVITITFDPFPVNGFVGGRVFPDAVNERRSAFEIVSNTVNSITVKTGLDMTAVGAISDVFRVETLSELGDGYDGVEEVDDAEYIAALDSGTSPARELFGRNKGFVKMCMPGVSSVQVQKAGIALADALNYQWRIEIPKTILDEQSAEEWVNDTLGRSNYGKLHFPSWAYVTNPLGAGLKLTSMSGSILGREALVAKNFTGYHKIAGGVDITLPNIVKLPTGDTILDEEFLNPQGINVIKKIDGNFVMWGARLIATDPAFKFAQKREQLSHYENIFRENFDYIIFALNNAQAQSRLETSFISFFLPEFAKSAIVGNSFEDAVRIKIDDENNPAEELVQGNLNAEITVRIVDTVERFIITIGQAGIFEDLAA